MQDDVWIEKGPLKALWQKQETHLRSISFAGSEILRGIYVALRDENWGTLPPIIEDYQFIESELDIKIMFSIRWKTDSVDFRGSVKIVWSIEGNLNYHFSGKAFSSFKSNRIGFLVLHPSELAGKSVEIQHVDGKWDQSQFPTNISPDQPFYNIRSIRHKTGGLEVTTTLTGDTFEMEDQRNWTDASFKTYCTPLSLPFPRIYQTGDKVDQSISVNINPSKGIRNRLQSTAPKEITIAIEDNAACALPKLGFEFSENAGPHSDPVKEKLKSLRPDHIRVTLDLTKANYIDSLRSACDLAKSIESTLELAVFITGGSGNQWEHLKVELDQQGVEIARWLIFENESKCTSHASICEARNFIDRGRTIRAPLFAGTDAFFTELNREPIKGNNHEGVTFSINPQVHAFDDRSLIETLPVQATCVRSAKSFSKMPVAVSPITFKMRWNPNAQGSKEMLPPRIRHDPRQDSQFGVLWTLGSFKYLAESEATSLTYYETLGLNGIYKNDPQKQQDSSVASAFSLLADNKDRKLIKTCSTHPLEVDSMLFTRNHQKTLVVWNYTEAAKKVSISSNTSKSETINMLPLTVQSIAIDD